MSCPFGYGNSSPHFQQLASKGRSNGTLLTRGEKSEEDIENTTLLSPDNVNGMESSEAPASNSSSSGEEVAHRSLEGSTNASPEDKRSMKMTPKHQMLRAMNDAKNTTDHPYYRDYIGLKTILHSQHPLSAKVGEPAHDEMLFIITHQTYELWFKQILHELRRIYSLMLPENVSSLHSIQTASTLLLRIHMIQANLIKQMDILDTMTPMSFLEFRDYLVPASGFQSVQFRMIEILMGLPIEKRRMWERTQHRLGLSISRRARVEGILPNFVGNWDKAMFRERLFYSCCRRREIYYGEISHGRLRRGRAPITLGHA